MATSLAEDPRDRAFEHLYSRYVRDVYRYVLAVLRNPAEAEDVTQVTFLNAYRALQAGEEPQKPHNWLIAIAHNVCRSRMRFTMRRPKEVPLDVVVEQLEVPESERPNIRELLRALGRLPFNQRAAITMRELEGRSYVDIADTLGVTVPAAEALIGRARRTLRSHASAIRGLTVVGVPRSLRNLLGHGETAGGAIGGAAIAKAAALVVAGVVAGGVGMVAKSEAQGQRVQIVHVVPGIEAVMSAAPAKRGRVARGGAVADALAQRSGPPVAASGRPSGTGRPRIDTSGDAPPPRPAASPSSSGSTASGSSSASSAPAPTARHAVRTAAAPVASTVPSPRAVVHTVTEPVHGATEAATAAVAAAQASVPPAVQTPQVPPVPAVPQPPPPPPVPTITIP